MDITSQITTLLEDTQRESEVRVVYACESGSRAWGFESADSDFDVRFVYVHKLEWYLSIDEHRDVIERPISDEIDLSGWDLRKALRLLRKSNPPLLEWLQSPIVYKQIESGACILRSEIQNFYSPKSCMYHYLHMAKGNFREYLRKDTVRQKKYFYVLRPVLACLWIEKQLGPVPMEFSRLLDANIGVGRLRSEIESLLIKKRAGSELSQGPRIDVINEFLETEIERLGSSVSNQVDSSGDSERLDQAFREILDIAWQA